MIAIGVFVAIVFVTLVYEFIKATNAKPRLAILVVQTVAASTAFALAWDINIVRFVAGLQAVIEVLNLVSVVSPRDFKGSIVPTLRTVHIAALLPAAAEREYASFALFIVALALCMLDVLITNRILIRGALPHHHEG